MSHIYVLGNSSEENPDECKHFDIHRRLGKHNILGASLMINMQDEKTNTKILTAKHNMVQNIIVKHDKNIEYHTNFLRPENYVAKDEIYGILKDFEEESYKLADISLAMINQRISQRFDGFKENNATISAYKSQYKKSFQFRPASEASIITIINVNKKFDRFIEEVSEKYDVDIQTLKSIIMANLNAADD